MPDPISALHPRKLYAMVRACPTSESRAQAALEFLRGCAGSEGGFLLLLQGSALRQAASTQAAVAPAWLVEEASRTWDFQLEAQHDDHRTLDISEIQALGPANDNPLWTGPNGEAFERRLLSTYRSTLWVPIGMVALRVPPDRALAPVRHAHIEALCHALIDAGDVAESSPNGTASSG